MNEVIFAINLHMVQPKVGRYETSLDIAKSLLIWGRRTEALQYLFMMLGLNFYPTNLKVDPRYATIHVLTVQVNSN